MSIARWLLDSVFVVLVLLVPVTIAMAGEKLAQITSLTSDQEVSDDEG